MNSGDLDCEHLNSGNIMQRKIKQNKFEGQSDQSQFNQFNQKFTVAYQSVHENQKYFFNILYQR